MLITVDLYDSVSLSSYSVSCKVQIYNIMPDYLVNFQWSEILENKRVCNYTRKWT